MVTLPEHLADSSAPFLSRYTAANIMFLAEQNPAIIDVRPASEWLTLGFKVKKGEKSLKIWAPIPRKNAEEVAEAVANAPTPDHAAAEVLSATSRPGFKLVPVFDFMQCEPIADWEAREGKEWNPEKWKAERAERRADKPAKKGTKGKRGKKETPAPATSTEEAPERTTSAWAHPDDTEAERLAIIDAMVAEAERNYLATVPAEDQRTHDLAKARAQARREARKAAYTIATDTGNVIAEVRHIDIAGHEATRLTGDVSRHIEQGTGYLPILSHPRTVDLHDTPQPKQTRLGF